MKRYGFTFLAVSLTAAVVVAQGGDEWNPLPPLKGKAQERDMPAQERAAYAEAIRRTANMVNDSEARLLTQRHKLDVLNVTWEDTGRYKGSAVGPNISDMTIQVGVRQPSGKYDVKAMPVIRHPNFSDITADLDPREFTLLVGNEKGRALRRVSLYDFLENPTAFLSKPSSWLGRNRSLLADRDDKVLVSAQACFLPVPKRGIATFNPVVFNYQSTSGDPAVLTILATREGSSTTIIDNKRDAFEPGAMWGQRLFHNSNGMRASLTGQRESDYRTGTGSGRTGTPRTGHESGLSMVLLVQVPLKQKNPMRGAGGGGFGGGAYDSSPVMKKSAKSDVETAVIGHGELEGPFTEIDNLAIERDPRFPVRVTVQFYKATSNGIVDEKDIAEIRQQIDRVYARGDVVGSLVTEGDTGRITEYYGAKVQPQGWWEEFWRRHEQNTGDTREEAMRKLRRLLGQEYQQRPVTELYLRSLLRQNRR
ncbi:MAG TPA: hypothetical protein VEX38_02910 [Fimbriimonadaceae bacterium]|nr:hypothetical protein [Fimbriimonadaceae bacterium]